MSLLLGPFSLWSLSSVSIRTVGTLSFGFMGLAKDSPLKQRRLPAAEAFDLWLQELARRAGIRFFKVYFGIFTYFLRPLELGGEPEFRDLSTDLASECVGR